MKHVLYTLATALWLAAIPHQATAACVSGVPQGKPDSLYTISDDGNTVTDNRTGLTWLRCMVGQSGSDCTVGTREAKSWGDALAAASEANTNNLHGHNDWRLPNIKELFSLVEQCQESGRPSINETVFPNTNPGPAWSSTVANREIGSAVAGSNKVWAIDFSSWGQSIQHSRYPSLPTDTLTFRLVRGPAPVAPPTPVDGACGSAHNSASTPLLTSAPSGGLCSAGTASSITSASTTFTWSCAGTGGGTTDSCQAPRGYSVSPSAGANGSISPAGAQVVAYEATPIFTLTADSGYALDSVGGTCGGSLSGSSYGTNPVTADCTVAVSFKWVPLPTYAINTSASPAAGGSVACAPNPVTQGGSSTCTASAAAGYTFTGFSGACTGMTCSLSNVTSIQSVTAHFAPITYAVTTAVSPAEGGTLSCSPNPVAHGSASTCTASAAAGYTFTGFS
ncbi:MAG: DUF1566 domain-containing protein, partial [Acidovorax sp.]|nr:DUF1566 domain-containing protein [Acidovorax sp.]